jgi:aspartyl-tRNA(Asn)/glutamyl-tRNA(Gln) amidotransferase subunit B
MKWESVIGLEVHTQLATQSKIFSGASCTYGAEPNTQACAIDLGLPGVLPVLNEKVVELAILFGLSIQAEIPLTSIFARKNYFYPDLPKGYQISQYEHPIVKSGQLPIQLPDGSKKIIGITRAHLEEDAGKSLHEGLSGKTGIDLNRAGTPLLEIVSEPDMRSAPEAIIYLKTLHSLVRYLGISDGNMQEGSFRCDVNISLRPFGSTRLGTRTELKNLNSFRFIEKAILFEIERQAEILENGGTIIQETRQYDSDKDITRSLRSKEEAHDYRYFPDPDLLPVVLDENFITKVRKTMPELPWEKQVRFQEDYGLSVYDANLIVSTRESANYFEHVLQITGKDSAKIAANWINGELAAALNKSNLEISESPILAEQLAGILQRITDQSISNNIGKQVFEILWNNTDKTADQIIAEQGLQQITDVGEIEKIVDEIIASHPMQAEQFRAGKQQLFGFFVGQVMKATGGKANPQHINELLKKKLAP